MRQYLHNLGKLNIFGYSFVGGRDIRYTLLYRAACLGFNVLIISSLTFKDKDLVNGFHLYLVFVLVTVTWDDKINISSSFETLIILQASQA